MHRLHKNPQDRFPRVTLHFIVTTCLPTWARHCKASAGSSTSLSSRLTQQKGHKCRAGNDCRHKKAEPSIDIHSTITGMPQMMWMSIEGCGTAFDNSLCGPLSRKLEMKGFRRIDPQGHTQNRRGLNVVCRHEGFGTQCPISISTIQHCAS